LQVNYNDFVRMPRGKVQLEMVGTSRFSRDENIVFDGLVHKISKVMSKTEGDNLMYLVNKQNELDIKRRGINFDTFFFDDIIKVSVYQKGIVTKNNQVGRGVLDMRELAYEAPNSIIGLPVVNKKLKRTMGYLYFRVTYQPRSENLFDKSQFPLMQHPSKFDKFLYFDNLLATNFNFTCHYGYLQVTLAAVDIP
jgi:hypothetical protein